MIRIPGFPGKPNLGTFLIVLFFMAILFPSRFSAYAVSPQYKSIIERDPFDPKRGQDKTTVQGGAVSTEGSELEKRYSVYGVILAGHTKFAYIKPVKSERREESQELRKISVGDLVDGWKVRDITDRGLLMASGDEQVILKVFAPKKERKSDRPVGLATPRPVGFATPRSRPARPVINPADRERWKAALKRSKHPEIKPGFISPKKMNGQLVVNPFLKALQKQKEMRREKEERR